MIKKIIIHDMSGPQAEMILGPYRENSYIFSAEPLVKHCIGCFNCWTKTPGSCIIRDRQNELLQQMADCQNIIVISRCVYGGLSPAVKRVWDRCIGCVQPFFYIDKKTDEMHHRPRYPEGTLDYYLWGRVTSRERQTAAKLLQGNAKNFNMQPGRLKFYDTPEQMKGVLL